MKFDLWSDFHVEGNQPFHWDKHYPTSKILVMAGDTSNSVERTMDVVGRATDVYEHVLFVDGNHDHYEGRKIEYMRFENSKPNRSTFLWGPTYYTVDDTIFIGNMGWYSWDYPYAGPIGKQAHMWMDHLNDAKFIDFNNELPRDMAERHARELEYKLSYMRKDYERVVVVTHTVPHIKGLVGPEHRWAPLNGSYYNSFMQRVWYNENKPDIWCFGHTHFPNDFVDNGVRFISNPRGYKGEGSRKKLPICIDTEEVLEYK